MYFFILLNHLHLCYIRNHNKDICYTFYPPIILNKNYNESWVIFEPHTYSRVKNHYVDFAKSLVSFDNIIITDIYAAREVNEFGVKESDIINELKKLGKDAIHISDFKEIKKHLKEML